MPPHNGLVHPKEYDIKDSNIEFIGADIDHSLKYKSASTEPAWQANGVGTSPGLFIWRIEDFQVVPIPEPQYGQFYEGDSYIILRTVQIGKDHQQNVIVDQPENLIHDIFFWLGRQTTQDEAGTAAYKTVELDEFLHGAATQHRELQTAPSDEFLHLFPKMQIKRGGVKSGFTHVVVEAADSFNKQVTLLLRVMSDIRHRTTVVVVHEVSPTWQSLDEADVFILDKGDKIWVWQGKKCSPMEKAKAAQVVADMTLAKHVDVEVLSQNESRSGIVVEMLGGDRDAAVRDGLEAARPVALGRERKAVEGGKQKRRQLFRISDESGEVRMDLEATDDDVVPSILSSQDLFLFDDCGSKLWVWQGQNASRGEKAAWLGIVQAYSRVLQAADGAFAAALPCALVKEGNESTAFFRAIAV